MATLTITNISLDKLYLSDLYTSIQPGKSVQVERSASDLPRMKALQGAIADGFATLSVQYSSDEVASGALAPPSTVEAGDLAPVADTFPVGGVVSVFKAVPAGAGGSPDDVEVWPAGGLPFKFRVLDFVAYVTTAVGGSSLQLRDQSGGGGALLASSSSASTGRQANTAGTTTVATPDPTKGLFVRRSDSGVAVQVVAILRPEL
jgi:hypothetical protein